MILSEKIGTEATTRACGAAVSLYIYIYIFTSLHLSIHIYVCLVSQDFEGCSRLCHRVRMKKTVDFVFLLLGSFAVVIFV